MKGENGMTEAQKKAVEVQKEIEEACIRRGRFIGSKKKHTIRGMKRR